LGRTKNKRGSMWGKKGTGPKRTGSKDRHLERHWIDEQIRGRRQKHKSPTKNKSRFSRKKEDGRQRKVHQDATTFQRNGRPSHGGKGLSETELITYSKAKGRETKI